MIWNVFPEYMLFLLYAEKQNNSKEQYFECCLHKQEKLK